jgi:Tfp pilus assembly protein PilP
MKKAIIFLMLCFLLFVITGCNKEQPEKKPMAEKVRQTDVKKDRKPQEETKKVEQEEVIYDAKGKKDPFLSLVELTKQKPVKKRGASPFESYDVEEVKILAIAWAKDKYYALIRLPDNKNYTITEGMAMGLQGGKVEKITKEMVVIREYVKDYRGDIKPRDAILKLHKGEEE